MIFILSGTGNSRYVANHLSKLLDDNDLREVAKVKTDPSSVAQMQIPTECRSIGFVFPVWSWGVPPIVLDLIAMLPDSFFKTIKDNGIKVWSVMTCGDETGMAPSMLSKALNKRGVDIDGMWSIIMPNNYVVLPGFDVDSKEVEQNKLNAAPARIDHIAKSILAGDFVTDCHLGPWPRTKTKLVWPLFKRWGIFPDKWHSTDACIGCGKCASVCPVNNITMIAAANGPVRDEVEDGAWQRPSWGKDCISCLACYHICPTDAVQYGKSTQKKGHYRTLLLRRKPK